MSQYLRCLKSICKLLTFWFPTVVDVSPMSNRHSTNSTTIRHHLGRTARDASCEVTASSKCAHVHHALAVHCLKVLPDDAPGDAGLEDYLMFHEYGTPLCRYARPVPVARWDWGRRPAAEAHAAIVAWHSPRASNLLSVVQITAAYSDAAPLSGPVEDGRSIL